MLLESRSEEAATVFSCRKVGVGAAALSVHDHCCSSTGIAYLAWRQLPSLPLPLASLNAGWDTRSSTMKHASFYCGALVSCKLEAMRDQSWSTPSWWVPAYIHFFQSSSCSLLLHTPLPFPADLRLYHKAQSLKDMV